MRLRIIQSMNNAIQSFNLSEIPSLLEGLGQPRFRAKQLTSWLYQRGAHSYDEMTNLPKALREVLTAEYPLIEPKVVNKQVSHDGTRKYVFEYADGAKVEAVGIPSFEKKETKDEPKHLTVCFSTQAGCAMGCTFCATGHEGLTRNLSSAEMVCQIIAVRQDFGCRVTNLVSMGQGEPFQNYQATMEALRFANDGCWEVQIPGKTCFSYVPFDALAIFLHDTLRVDEETPLPYGDFEALYRAYLRDLGAKVDAICAGAIAARLETDGRGNFRWKEALPCGVVSLFEEGCVENARSYLEGGPRYTVISPHIGGAPDVGNSLLAIDRLVYREKRVTLDELRAILRANWEGHEPLRQYVLNRYTYYGNDDDAADAYTARLLDDFAAMVLGHNGESPILFPPGVSTFGRQIEWAPGRAATPFGARKGDVLAPNASPTPGTDEAGATALIRSYCKLGLGRLTCGAALDVKLLPALARGENGANALVALSGAVMAQKNRVFEISMGTGAIVFGLAAVIIGTNIFKNRQKVNSSTAAIVGSIIYKACVALALSMGLVPQDLKLVTAALFLIILVLGNVRRKKVKFHA